MVRRATFYKHFADKYDFLAAYMRDLSLQFHESIQQKMESENNELNFDFIELCPSSVYNNEYYAEPQW